MFGEETIDKSFVSFAFTGLTASLHLHIISPQVETRLFTIVTGEYEDDLICSISRICLESPPEYEALSYVWANPLSNQKDDDGDDLNQEIKAWTYVNGELNQSIETLWLRISWTIPSINTGTTSQADSDPLGASSAIGLR